MKIVVIGAGYVGLVSGACFADFGHQVTCIDNHIKKIELLKKGEIPFFEPGLQRLVKSNIQLKRLTFDIGLSIAVGSADAVFIAVGTPPRDDDGSADLSYVESAAREIARNLKGFTSIIIKSTVPIGTGDQVEEIITKENPNADFAIVSNPEFLREGSAIYEFKHPDRIIIGTNDERTKETMRELYRPLFLNETPILFTDRRTAELIKYAANAFLATKITFINEMANLCEAAGANIQHVAKGIGLDNRIGNKFLNVGPGYGGSCFPKDTLALARTAKNYGSPVEIVETVIRANEARKISMVDKIIKACGGSVTNKRIAILGLTFKQNTDDLRDAPSLTIIPELQRKGALINSYDPEGMKVAQTLLDGVCFADDPYECIENASALVILTEWDQFRALDLDLIYKILKEPIIIDLRNIYQPEKMEKSGFKYVCIGRKI